MWAWVPSYVPLSKRCVKHEFHRFSTVWVTESQPLRVQQQARCAGLHAPVAIQRIAQHGVAQGRDMHTQLAGAAGEGVGAGGASKIWVWVGEPMSGFEPLTSSLPRMCSTN